MGAKIDLTIKSCLNIDDHPPPPLNVKYNSVSDLIVLTQGTDSLVLDPLMMQDLVNVLKAREVLS